MLKKIKVLLFITITALVLPSLVKAQEGAHQHQSLEAQIQSLTERVEALESRPTDSPSGVPTDPGAQQVDPPPPGAENEALDPNMLNQLLGAIGRDANRFSNGNGPLSMKIRQVMGNCGAQIGRPLQNLGQAVCICTSLKHMLGKSNPISRSPACRTVTK